MSFIDENQNIWFEGKEIAQLLGYKDTDQTTRHNVDSDDIMSRPLYYMGHVL